MRLEILKCIARDIVATDDIIAEIGGDAAKVRNNLQAARADSLIESYRDDITNRPAYRLTDKGRERLKALRKSGGETESEGGDADVQAEREAMPDPDPVLLASANRMLSDRLAAVAKVLRGTGIHYLKNIEDGEDLQPYAIRLAADFVAHRDTVIEWERTMAEAIGEDGPKSVAEAVEAMKSQIAGLQRELGQERTARQSLAEQVEAMHAQLDARESATFIVRAPKTPPRIVFRQDRAIERAKSLARRVGRADVYALHRIGKAVRGAEWVEVSP